MHFFVFVPELFLFLRDPAAAPVCRDLPCAGVGLLRMDEILVDDIRVHPLALLHRHLLRSPAVERQIDELTEGYHTPTDYFVDGIAHRLAHVAELFAPRPVVVRFTDLTSDAYADLIGGALFEPHEDLPELGLRGAARYVSDHYRGAFELECEAIRRARKAGADNLQAVIPFCRTVEEVDSVLDAMTEAGLGRGEPGFEIHAMAEVPATVVMVRELAQRVDGLSIGSDDLAKLVLGAAPSSSALPPLDYGAEPIRRFIAQLARAAHAWHVPLNLCGPGAEHPELAAFAIAEGVERLTVRPEAFEAAYSLYGRNENEGAGAPSLS